MLPSQFWVNLINNNYNTVLAALEYSLCVLLLAINIIFIGFGMWLFRHRKE